MGLAFSDMNQFPDIYAFVLRHLRAKAIPLRKLAAEGGVPFSNVADIAQGSNQDPGVHSIQRLADYFSPVGPASSPCCAPGHDDQQHVAEVEAA